MRFAAIQNDVDEAPSMRAREEERMHGRARRGASLFSDGRRLAGEREGIEADIRTGEARRTEMRRGPPARAGTLRSWSAI